MPSPGLAAGSGGFLTATRLENPLRRSRVLGQQMSGAGGARHQVTAAVGALSGQRRADAPGTEGALERADHGVHRVRRQVPVATFAVRSHLQHGGTPDCRGVELIVLSAATSSNAINSSPVQLQPANSDGSGDLQPRHSANVFTCPSYGRVVTASFK